MPKKCNPCVRYKVLPMCRVAQPICRVAHKTLVLVTQLLMVSKNSKLIMGVQAFSLLFDSCDLFVRLSLSRRTPWPNIFSPIFCEQLVS